MIDLLYVGGCLVLLSVTLAAMVRAAVGRRTPVVYERQSATYTVRFTNGAVVEFSGDDERGRLAVLSCYLLDKPAARARLPC